MPGLALLTEQILIRFLRSSIGARVAQRNVGIPFKQKRRP